MNTMNDRTLEPRGTSAARADRGQWKVGAVAVLRKLGAAGFVLGIGLGIGCAATPPCRPAGAKGAVVLGARTAGEAVEAGAETGVEGIKTAGRAAGGMVEGGSDKAEEEWNKGKVETKAEGREGSAEVEREASVPVCKE